MLKAQRAGWASGQQSPNNNSSKKGLELGENEVFIHGGGESREELLDKEVRKYTKD